MYKGKGEYRGIGLVEVLCKMIIPIINTRIRVSVSPYDALHGFRQRRGVVTYALEAKLSHQQEGIYHEPLLQVFHDTKKAYESLDMTLFM